MKFILHGDIKKNVNNSNLLIANEFKVANVDYPECKSELIANIYKINCDHH